MYKRIILLFLFVFLIAPFVNAETLCDGSLCLTYNTSYNSPLVHTNYYTLDSNTSGTYFLGRVTGSGDNSIYVFNSTWNLVDTLSTGAFDFTNGISWYNNSGTETLVGIRNFVGTDYARTYTINGTYILSYTYPDDMNACDWFSNSFFCGDTSSLEIYNNTFGATSVCGTGGTSVVETHHLTTEADKILYLDDAVNDAIVLYDHATCSELGRIVLGDFAGIDPAYRVGGVVVNPTDTKVWVYMSGLNPAKIFEFDANFTAVESTLTPVYPTNNMIINNNNLIMMFTINAGLNGSAMCYINTTLTYSNTSIINGTDTIRFDSGALADGHYYWWCNFTDIGGGYWSFNPVNFTIVTGIGVEIGEDMADFFGFETNSFGTAQEQGLWLFSLIIILCLGVGSTLASGNAGLGMGGMFIGILIFTGIGWLPIWIGIASLVFTGLIIFKIGLT